MAKKIEPMALPPFNLPYGDETVEVHIINTTSDLVCPADGFVSPVLKGQEVINMPTYSFLIRHKPSNSTMLFDLGVRKDWWNYAPKTLASMKKGLAAINVPKNINDILKEGGVDENEITTVVLSHGHFDHCGDMSLFDKKTELVVGPGFKAAMLPGYPADKDAALLESDFAGRLIREISFFPTSTSKIGSLPSHDFYGDGSLHLLSTPGHATGHLSALARTTPTTFVLLAGDVCHFGGVYRPTPYNPIPDPIDTSLFLTPTRFPSPCPCSVFTSCHRAMDKETEARTSPFYDVTRNKDGFYADPETAQETVEALKLFDAHEDVFVAIAHDEGLLGVCGFWPQVKEGVNGWKEMGWKERARWVFLEQLPLGGKPAGKWICEGFWGGGREVDMEGL